LGGATLYRPLDGVNGAMSLEKFLSSLRDVMKSCNQMNRSPEYVAHQGNKADDDFGRHNTNLENPKFCIKGA